MNSSLTTSVQRWLRRLAVLSVFVGGSANAAIYTGVWDPPYGSPFTNLGWRGTTDYFVPDTCLPVGTAVIDNFADCGGAATVTAAQVQFYDASVGPSAPTLATLLFNPASIVIIDLSFVSGALDNLSTSGSDFELPSADLSAFGVGYATEFSLFFTLGDGPRLEWRDCSYYGERSYTHYPSEPECSFGLNDNVTFPVTDFTITRVPEPGTLALATLALLGFAPRRVRAALTRRA